MVMCKRQAAGEMRGEVTQWMEGKVEGRAFITAGSIDCYTVSFAAGWPVGSAIQRSEYETVNGLLGPW